MSAWSFRGRHGTCAACERAFEDEEPHFSALSVRDEELAREDLCRACWPERGAAPQGERPAPLFWWRTRHQVARRRGLALDFQAIEGLFLALEGRPEVHLRELRYVLCLLLMRKRRLKIERIVRDEAGEAMLVRRPRRKEALRVFVFDFDAGRMEALREELRRVIELDSGGTAESAAADSPRPAGSPGPGDETQALVE